MNKESLQRHQQIILCTPFNSMGNDNKPSAIQRLLSSEEVIKTRLKSLTTFLSGIATLLVPHPPSYLEFDRAYSLWSLFQKATIRLDKGGITSSLTLPVPSRDYSGYDLQTSISQEELKRFLMEEGVVEGMSQFASIHVTFTLGSHDGYVQILSLFSCSQNHNELLFPSRSYGLFYNAAGALNYKIHLVDVDVSSGEKITIPGLRKAVLFNPKAKLLYLDAKTVPGIFYTKEELTEIIKICKRHQIFLIFDTTHLGLELQDSKKQASIIGLCQSQDYIRFAILYTASKTYGLERGRVGFVVSHSDYTCKDVNNQDTSFHCKLNKTIYERLGTIPEDPLILAHSLVSTSITERKIFRQIVVGELKENLYLMIAYLEGVDSDFLDQATRDRVKSCIPDAYHSGVPSLKLVAIPEGGFQIKVDVSQIINKYFMHFHISNSEVIFYLMSAFFNVIILCGSMILDFSNCTIRLSFVSRSDVHDGMQAFHKFVSGVTEEPYYCDGMGEVFNYSNYRERNIDQVILRSKEAESTSSFEVDMQAYRKNIRKLIPLHSMILVDEEKSIHLAAVVIQGFWKNCLRDQKRKDSTRRNIDLVSFNSVGRSEIAMAGVSMLALGVGFFACRKYLASTGECISSFVKGLTK